MFTLFTVFTVFIATNPATIGHWIRSGIHTANRGGSSRSRIGAESADATQHWYLDQAIKLLPRDIDLRRERVERLFVDDQFEQVLDEIRPLQSLEPRRFSRLCLQAVTSLRSGDVDAFRMVCHEMLERYADFDDPVHRQTAQHTIVCLDSDGGAGLRNVRIDLST